MRIPHAVYIIFIGICISANRFGYSVIETPRDGSMGGVLDARSYTLVAPGDTRYGQMPLTIECRVKLLGTQSYNVFIANETKASSGHWELFTTPGDGVLHAYFPGRLPDHVHTTVPLKIGHWHVINMIMTAEWVRLFLDDILVGETNTTMTQGDHIPGPLAIGGLVEGGFGCSGLIDEVRISSGIRCSHRSTEVPWDVDQATLALWRFDTESLIHDTTGRFQKGMLRPSGKTLTPSGYEIPGGMPATLQPLPEPEDVSGLRSALTTLVDELGLESLKVSDISDSVLRQWNHDFHWEGKKEYPESRPGGPDEEKLRREVYDVHALVHESDGGPVGTVLRRTGALLAHLNVADHEPAARDYHILSTAMKLFPLERDSPHYKTFYLAICAVRRQIAFMNPLIDFDEILCVVRGTFEGSVRSNPETSDAQGGHFVTQYFGFNALPGGGLYIIRNYKGKPEIINVLGNAVVQNGRLKGCKLDYGAFATPDLSYDGKTIVFAWTENAEHQWIYSKKKCFHLFKVHVDGSNLVQLTDGAFNDFDPCWLPNGRIAFISERRGGYIRCFAQYLKVRTYTLFSMQEDGGDIRPMSYFETSEWNPSVNNQGQLVYTRWDYVDRENCLGTRFWISNPDGSNARAPHGNYPHPFHTFPDRIPWRIDEHGKEWDSRWGAPLVEIGIRAVPNSSLYMFTAAPHHGSVYGSLCMLDLRPEDDGHMSQIKRVTPYEPFPESEMPGRRHYRFGTPWPLSEDFYLCNEWENLILLDRFGNRELLCDLRSMPCPQDERLRIIDPIPVSARPCPLVTPHPPSVTQKAPIPATIAVMNVYISDLPFPEGVKVKWLRVVQNIPKSNHAMGEPMIGYERENTPRIPLGIVPVEEDGSAYFEAPVAKQLIFQVLDENYMAVQSMRSSAYVHPGEQLSCLGCHEKTHDAPHHTRIPLALQRPPSKLQPECGPVEPISYYRQIKPIFEKRCLPCHVESDSPLKDMSYENLKEDYTFWFSGAMLGGMVSDYSGIHGGSRTIPGRFGARASKLGQMLLTERHQASVPWEERHKIIQWLDCNSLRLGAYTREDAQIRGELVWPALDVDPNNVQGIDGTLPTLRGYFWHENTYGPYPLLIAELEHNRIAILDKTGAILWEYPVPHPQDVWMLPNGNILIAYHQGIREITPNKETIWQYTKEEPGKISTCQPLPDGNILIGMMEEDRLVEVNRLGELLREVTFSSIEQLPHRKFRYYRKSPYGTYLVSFTEEGIVREYDNNGNILREFPKCTTPVGIFCLDNGNTLITEGNRITEYERNNKIVWELLEHEIPDVEIGLFVGVQRLENGNTLVCNWNTRDTEDKEGIHIFEVTDDKRIVWQLIGAHIGRVAQCQVLSADFSLVRWMNEKR